MPRYQSPLAAAMLALEEQRRQQREQQQQDAEEKLRFAEWQAQQEARRQDLARQGRIDTERSADRLAGIVSSDQDLTPEQAATFRAGGYQVNDMNTLPSTRTIAGLGLPVPGGNEASDNAGLPRVMIDPTGYSRRAETFGEKTAREAREAAQAERDEQRTFRNDQAAAQRTFQAEQNEANRQARAEQSQAERDLKVMIAQMTQSNNVETRALGNQLKALQVQAAQDKLEAARAEREQAKRAKSQGRADVRELAQSLIDDKGLDAISGNVGALTPDVLPGSIDARKRLEQLMSKLSLEGRQQLKGQGAVSDFEAKLLGAAASAIDLRAGAAKVREHLKSIVNMMTDGDAPNGANGGNPPVVRWGRDANGRPVRQQ